MKKMAKVVLVTANGNICVVKEVPRRLAKLPAYRDAVKAKYAKYGKVEIIG